MSFKKYLRNFEGTDIDCSMCSTILPSGDSFGTTLEVPSEALLHRSKLQCTFVQITRFWAKNSNKFDFYHSNPCVFQIFVVILQSNLLEK